jgi:putative salt-induced outer membrane protein
MSRSIAFSVFGTALVFAFVGAGPLFAAPETESTAKPAWNHSAEASLLLTSGNTAVTTLGLGATSEFNAAPWSAKGSGSYLQSSSAGVSVAELFTVDLRGDRAVVESLSSFVQLGILRNVFTGFNSRVSADAGFAYALLSRTEHTLSIEAGLGAITESRTDTGTNTFGTARFSGAYKWKISPTADFESKLSLLDNLANISDLRLSSLNSLSLVMTSVLSTKFSFRLDYLNTPVAGKRALDTATTVALVAKF